MKIRHKVLDWFGPSRGVIVIRPVLMYYAIEIGSSLLFFRDLSDFLGWPRCGSILSIYSQETVLQSLAESQL
jgi:hypothetical protein